MTNLNTRAAEYLAKADAATPGPYRCHIGETYHITAPDLGRVCVMTNLKGAHGMGGRRDPKHVAATTKLFAASHDAAQIIRDYQRREAELVAECERLRELVRKARPMADVESADGLRWMLDARAELAAMPAAPHVGAEHG